MLKLLLLYVCFFQRSTANHNQKRPSLRDGDREVNVCGCLIRKASLAAPPTDNERNESISMSTKKGRSLPKYCEQHIIQSQQSGNQWL
ncbi:hypothetical protein NPIL_229411 [Nephila pilipes]|uniref:Secreted protein n=1 Tax=Nephila pilipes TaxID=299642 RepID=A0A8X6QPQ0_NEPPI|nr:hypothetical protein NPIL_229411 [Nephila pilipes]